MKRLLILCLLVVSGSCYASVERECLHQTGNTWGCELWRYRIPQGWLVTTGVTGQAGITFVPDVFHTWQG